MSVNLSQTSLQIIKILAENGNTPVHVNEFIRLTGRYPNSVQQSLKTLKKQKIVKSYRSGRRRLYHLNDFHPHLSEIKKLANQETALYTVQTTPNEWTKILNRQASYPFVTAWATGLVHNMKKTYGLSMTGLWHNSITYGVYHIKNDLESLGRVISEKIYQDLDFAQKDIALCIKTCDTLVEVSRKIPTINLSQKSDSQLAKFLKRFYTCYLDVFPFVTVPHGIERYFEQKIREAVVDENCLEILLAPVSTQDKERDSALKVAVFIKDHGWDRKAERVLAKHWEDFCWLPLWSIHAKPLSLDYFREEVQNILAAVENPASEIKRLKTEEQKARKKLRKTLKKVKASPALIEEVKLLQEYVCLRVYRKNALCQAHFYYLPLIFEIGRRLDLDEEEIKLLSFEEMLAGLTRKFSKKDLKLLVEKRDEGWAILMRHGKTRTVTGVKNIIETMEQHRIIATDSSMRRVIRGTPACRGKATGRIKIVKKVAELSKVEEGDILVTKMTTPDYVMAMHQAAAIVTDEGGITCHAAIVSREFNIPCIIGTRNATQVLSDNDLVEVDAENGVVRVIESVDLPENVKSFSGRTIFKGRVRGIARIVLDAADFGKIQKNDILITPQTTPEYLSSLYRVKGFVVDEESLTSHAVLYGKALEIPSIMGTVYARHAIKDGERVELDATNGTVKRLG